MGLSESTVKDLQRDLNRFSRERGLELERLIVDGEYGPSTHKRVRYVMYLLGYGRERIRAGHINHDFRWQLRNPRRARLKSHRTRIRRGLKRRYVRRREVARNHIRAVRTSGVGYFDGKPVAKWIIPYLEWARRNGWQGRLVSGWRDPRYSEHLCYMMCGHPTCSGRCAGRGSAHSQSTYLAGAVDVSDYIRFGQLMARCPLTPHLVNHLPIDRVHYSVSGR